MAKVFLQPAGRNGFYVGREVAQRSHYLYEEMAKAETDSASGITVVPVPDAVNGDALVKLMESCERHHRAARGDNTSATPPEDADRVVIEGLDIESLLRLVGAAHRLSVAPMLTLAAERVASLLATASRSNAGGTSSRAGLPMDAYLRPVDGDAFADDDERAAAEHEFVFTLPDAGGTSAVVRAPMVAAVGGVSELTRFGTRFDRASGAATLFPTDPGAAAAAAQAAGTHGAAGTGAAGDAGAPGELLAVIGGEAPLLACLQRLDLRSLQQLKPLGRSWRRRARTALCSGAWAELMRARGVLDLGSTRRWRGDERCTAARFLANGGCERLTSLRADGFEALLPPLLEVKRADAATLLGALVTSPASADGGAAAGGRGEPSDGAAPPPMSKEHERFLRQTAYHSGFGHGGGSGGGGGGGCGGGVGGSGGGDGDPLLSATATMTISGATTAQPTARLALPAHSLTPEALQARSDFVALVALVRTAALKPRPHELRGGPSRLQWIDQGRSFDSHFAVAAWLVVKARRGRPERCEARMEPWM